MYLFADNPSGVIACGLRAIMSTVGLFMIPRAFFQVDRVQWTRSAATFAVCAAIAAVTYHQGARDLPLLHRWGLIVLLLCAMRWHAPENLFQAATAPRGQPYIAASYGTALLITSLIVAPSCSKATVIWAALLRVFGFLSVSCTQLLFAGMKWPRNMKHAREGAVFMRDVFLLAIRGRNRLGGRFSEEREILRGAFFTGIACMLAYGALSSAACCH